MEIWTAEATLAPLPGPVAAGCRTGNTVARDEPSPTVPRAPVAKRRTGWRSFLCGVALGSGAMGATAVALAAYGGLTLVPAPARDEAAALSAAPTPGIQFVTWSAAEAADPPSVTSGAEAQLRQPPAEPGPSGSWRQTADVMAAKVDGVRQQVDELNLLTSAVVLQDAVSHSQPFMAALALAMQSADDNADLLEPLDRLMSWADTGVETRAELTSRFAAVAEQVRLAEAQAQESMMRTATLVMRDMAVWIGVGDSEPPVFEQALQAASASLAAGRMDAAVTTLSALEGASATIIRPWLAAARARLTVEAEALHFQRLALGQALATRS